uniref:PDZ domain-containing protein n=1 Tax=Angiostrongylus cantonensis TaxID=6313 RepID=A0A158P6Y5_ANGCA
MSHEEDKDPPRDSNDFAEKFEAILLTLFEEYKKKEGFSKKLTDRQKDVAHCLQEFIVSGGLKLDKSAADTTSLCDGFISDWESTGIKSAAVQQLIALLNRPHVRGALISAEDIAANRYMPKLPAVPFEVDEDEGIAVKIVRIVKRDETLGATIKCEHGKMYIARLIAGGVAVRSACIQEGDRILEVNGLPIADLSVDDVARILNRVDCGTVTLKLVPAELPYSTTTNGVSHVYLRAQVSFV